MVDWAEAWARREGLSWHASVGYPPNILFGRTANGSCHGNVHPDAWRAILANDAWRSCLEKSHAQQRALPPDKVKAAREKVLRLARAADLVR